MSGPYEDIINLPHHVSATRSRMSMHDRAAQFSPFAALTGYDDAIREMRRTTVAPVELGADAMSDLNEKLCVLAQVWDAQPYVAVTCFVPDRRKCGGAYETVRGYVKKVDTYENALLLSDGRLILFEHILKIDFAEEAC